MSKKINIIFGLVAVAVAVFLCFIYCGRSNSAVFELQKGEAEALGVVLPEDGAEIHSYISLFDKFERDGQCEKGIVVAKKILEVFPEDKEESYLDLQSCYIKLKKYEEALVVNQKLIDMDPSDYRYVAKRAMIFDLMGEHDKAAKTFPIYK